MKILTNFSNWYNLLKNRQIEKITYKKYQTQNDFWYYIFLNVNFYQGKAYNKFEWQNFTNFKNF